LRGSKADADTDAPKSSGEENTEESEGWWTKVVKGTGAAYEKAKMYPYFVALFCLGAFLI